MQVIDETPRNRDSGDLTEADLQRIYDRVDREIKAKGLPTTEQIRRQIDSLNQREAS